MHNQLFLLIVICYNRPASNLVNLCRLASCNILSMSDWKLFETKITFYFIPVEESWEMTRRKDEARRHSRNVFKFIDTGNSWWMTLLTPTAGEWHCWHRQLANDTADTDSWRMKMTQNVKRLRGFLFRVGRLNIFQHHLSTVCMSSG